MRVAFVSSDWSQRGDKVEPGGAGYYRCALPAAGLSEFGNIEAQFFPHARSLPSGEIAASHRRAEQGGTVHDGFDVVVLQRWIHEDVASRVAAARAAGQIVVSDLDDHFWAIHRDNAASQIPTHLLKSYADSVRASTHVTVSTPFLADVVRGLGQPNVTVLRNAIDLRQWERAPIADEVRHIGWIGSTDHRSADLEQLGSALKRYLRNHPRVRFIHGGHRPGTTPAAKLLRIPVSSTIVRNGEPIARYPRLWRSIDVALCPLNPIDFNRAKSAIKAMEASAAGIPFIATDLDAYNEYGSGVLVKTEAEWLEALEQLTDLQTRYNLATTAAQRVQHEDISQRWTDWADLFSGLVNRADTTTSALT